jgi:hypothetical protein
MKQLMVGLETKEKAVQAGMRTHCCWQSSIDVVVVKVVCVVAASFVGPVSAVVVKYAAKQPVTTAATKIVSTPSTSVILAYHRTKPERSGQSLWLP